MGRKRVRAVTKGDVQRFLHDVASGKTATDVKTGKRGRVIVKGGKGTATRTVGLLGGIFAFAVDRGLRPDNPVRGVKRFKDRKSERFLSFAELTRLGETLTAIEREGENPSAIAAIRLLSLTGARKSEILTLKWEHVDFERACLRLTDSKTGAKVIPVGAPALRILASLPRLEGNPHVLPGEKNGAHFVGLPRAWGRIKARAGLNDVRLHDLRHSFASVAAGAGDSLILIGALLGHRSQATTQRYAHLSNDPLRAAADRTSGRIAAAMSGQQDAEVVDLRK
jgi:integrase